jgi:uncharacterized protein
MGMMEEIADGRTDLVFEYVAGGHAASSNDANGVPLIQHCAYYGDVSAIRFLLSQGAPLESLGENLGLSAACFHGHWQLCKFLLEKGADVNLPEVETGETPLHAALCKADSPQHTLVVKILLAAGANPNAATKLSAETGGFMRDVRTRGETPLHRAAAFADEGTIEMLIAKGAKLDAKDMNGDSPLSWASWHLRPASILRKLCYGGYRINPNYAGMSAYLRGKPHV